MVFTLPLYQIINIIIISIGIGICMLNMLQMARNVQIQDIFRRYFMVFFGLLLVYIICHLGRIPLEGHPGTAVWVSLQMLTTLELIASGSMTWRFSMLVLTASQLEERQERIYRRFITALLVLHIVVMLCAPFTGLCWYHDEQNNYHRNSTYLICNLEPMLLLIIDAWLLIRNGSKIERRILSSLWLYITAPLAAMILQSLFYGVQFIIAATIVGAMYVFIVLVQTQTEAYEKERLEKSRIETELSMASDIQTKMLPNIYPAFPDRKEIDIYATMHPAKEVGGDFYDYFIIDDRYLGMVMADVSGKGVPAALFMMVSKMLVQNYALAGLSPSAALEAVNRQICANNPEEMFVTVWLGKLDLTTGVLTAANAGHEFPVLKGPDGRFELIRDKHGFVIGGMENVRYREYEVALAPGSKLFVYTDGLAEAMNNRDEFFGTDRMLASLNRCADKSPKEILETVHEAVYQFTGEAPQFDDMTMLCLEFRGKGAPPEAE